MVSGFTQTVFTDCVLRKIVPPARNARWTGLMFFPFKGRWRAWALYINIIPGRLGALPGQSRGTGTPRQRPKSGFFHRLPAPGLDVCSNCWTLVPYVRACVGWTLAMVDDGTCYILPVVDAVFGRHLLVVLKHNGVRHEDARCSF